MDHLFVRMMVDIEFEGGMFLDRLEKGFQVVGCLDGFRNERDNPKQSGDVHG